MLGYLILHAPTEQGRANVSDEVATCGTTEKLADMATLYVTAIVQCCEYLLFPLTFNQSFPAVVRSAKGPTPAPSSHPSRPSLDDVSDTFLYMLLEAPQDHQRAKTLVNPSNVYG